MTIDEIKYKKRLIEKKLNNIKISVNNLTLIYRKIF